MGSFAFGAVVQHTDGDVAMADMGPVEHKLVVGERDSSSKDHVSSWFQLSKGGGGRRQGAGGGERVPPGEHMMTSAPLGGRIVAHGEWEAAGSSLEMDGSGSLYSGGAMPPDMTEYDA